MNHSEKINELVKAKELKETIINFVGKENIDKARITKDKHGVWLYNKKTMGNLPYYFDFNSVELLEEKDNEDVSIKLWRNELVNEFKKAQEYLVKIESEK
jgi:hypothetical protein